jgi:8-amino-3,8-dideoxy-alpha-D-manno-octulosonate transaminase
MPDLETARQAVKALAAAGVDGCFHWYDNKWHYIRKWDHFHRMKTASRLPVQALANCPDYSAISMPRSDAIMQRAISMQIKLGWTPQQLNQRIEAILEGVALRIPLFV